MSADLTGSHLDAATGRDEPIIAPGENDGDSDDEDDDDDDRDAARQARAAATKGGALSGDRSTGMDGTAAGTDGTGGGGGKGGAAAAGGGGGDGGEKPEKEMPRNKLVRSFFRGLLKEWEMDLNARPDHVKRTVQGKLETKTQKQAKDYMRPLFKLCKQKVRKWGKRMRREECAVHDSGVCACCMVSCIYPAIYVETELLLHPTNVSRLLVYATSSN